MKIRVKQKLLLACALSLHLVAQAQEKTYNTQGESGVFKLYKESIVIDYGKNDLPEASTTVTMERQILNENNIGQFLTEDVYHGYLSKLSELKAYTLLPTAKGDYKSVETKDFSTTSSSEGYIFYDDTKKTTVTFPGLCKNAKTLINYTVDIKDAHFLGAFYFQNYLPVEQYVFEVEAPNDMELKFVWKGDEAKWVKESKEVGRKKTKYTFSAQQVPKWDIQHGSKSIRNYVPHVIPLIVRYNTGSGKAVNYMSSTNDLYKYYYKYIQNVNTQLDPALKTKAEEITKNAGQPLQKAAAIYKWVQENIKYVAFEDSTGGYIPRQAKDVYEKRYGDCKDMASIIVAMCRAVGVSANYTWVGTREIPYSYNELPSPMCDNHMIATLRNNDSLYILDGTNSELPFGYIPEAIQNKEVLISIDKEKFEVVKLPKANAIQNISYDSTFISLKGNDVVGKMSTLAKGYGAWDLRTSYKMIDKVKHDEFANYITRRGNNKYQAKNAEVNLLSNKDQDLYVKADFDVKDFAQTVNDEIYINLNLKRNYEAQKIDASQAKAVLDNQYASCDKQYLEFTIPQGYRVDYLPPSISKSENGHWSFSINYKQADGKIILTKEIKYDLLDIEPKQVAAHNKLVDLLIEQYNESVVLKKIK